jgi:hypothetical protein
MTGGAGINAASSAQSRQVDTYVDHGGTGLEGGETRDGGRKTVGGGGSDISAAVKGPGDGETACLGPSRGGRGRINGERRASAGADGVVGDAGGVYQTGDAETARLRGGWGKQGG